MKKKSITLLLLFIGAFIYLLMCLFINNDYAYSNGELALDNLNEDGIMFNAKNQKHFICANVKNINIQNHIVYGFIKYEHSTLPIGEPGYFKNDKEAVKEFIPKIIEQQCNNLLLEYKEKEEE